MLAKLWKKILLAICVIAILFNLTSKLVRRYSLDTQLDSVVGGESLSTIFEDEEAKEKSSNKTTKSDEKENSDKEKVIEDEDEINDDEFEDEESNCIDEEFADDYNESNESDESDENYDYEDF